MSILIKGMEMPKSCSKCWFVEFTMREYKPCYQCYLTRETASEQDFERRGIRNCPLVEVPIPHGQLKDADELIKHDHQHYEYLSDEFYVLVRDIENAPTIIEAEEAQE